MYATGEISTYKNVLENSIFSTDLRNSQLYPLSDSVPFDFNSRVLIVKFNIEFDCRAWPVRYELTIAKFQSILFASAIFPAPNELDPAHVYTFKCNFIFLNSKWASNY